MFKILPNRYPSPSRPRLHCEKHSSSGFTGEPSVSACRLRRLGTSHERRFRHECRPYSPAALFRFPSPEPMRLTAMHGLRNQVRKTGNAMKTFLPSAPSISAASCLLGVWIAGAAGTVMSANAADSWNVLPAFKVILAQSPEIGLFQKYSGQIAVSSVIIGLAIFVVWTIYRRHHEAEARTLTGSYISDGVEATWIKFPDLTPMGAGI